MEIKFKLRILDPTTSGVKTQEENSFITDISETDIRNLAERMLRFIQEICFEILNDSVIMNESPFNRGNSFSEVIQT